VRKIAHLEEGHQPVAQGLVVGNQAVRLVRHHSGFLVNCRFFVRPAAFRRAGGRRRRRQQRLAAISPHLRNRQEERKPQARFHFNGTADGPIQDQLDQERQRKPGNHAAEGDQAEHLNQLPRFPKRRAGRLRHADVRHAAGTQSLVKPRLLQAGGEVAILGFLQLLFSLQLDDAGLEFVHRLGFGGQLVHLRIEHLDLGLQRRNRDARPFLQEIANRLAGLGGGRLQPRQPRIIRFQLLPRLFQRGDLLADAPHHRVLFRVLGQQPLLLFAKRIQARDDVPIRLQLFGRNFGVGRRGGGFRLFRQQLLVLLEHRLLLGQFGLGVEQFLPDFCERLAIGLLHLLERHHANVGPGFAQVLLGLGQL